MQSSTKITKYAPAHTYIMHIQTRQDYHLLSFSCKISDCAGSRVLRDTYILGNFISQTDTTHTFTSPKYKQTLSQYLPDKIVRNKGLIWRGHLVRSFTSGDLKMFPLAASASFRCNIMNID